MPRVPLVDLGRIFHVDYSPALTPGQLDAAYAAARDQFFNIDHTP